jgi:hypothetical protein
MNEWTAAAPIIIETEPQPSRRADPQAGPRPLRPWAVGLLAPLALFMAWSGMLLLVCQALWGYEIPTMIAPIALLAAGQIVVVALVYAIAWRTGKLQ